MGGHGGLNILPQKKWNVYNFENREKVRKDEEAAAKEEQLKREQTHKRDFEFRLEKLRQARGLASTPSTSTPSDSHHINLFDGLDGFSSLAAGPVDVPNGEGKSGEKDERSAKRKREAAPVVVAPEDEKYRMGYGVAGKGVKAPWYLSRPVDVEKGEGGGGEEKKKKEKKRDVGKKTIEELREERMRREKREKEREQKLVAKQRRGDTSSYDGHWTRRSRFS